MYSRQAARSLSFANFCDEETGRPFVFGAMQASEGRVLGSSKQGMGFKGRAFGKDHMAMTGHALGSNVGDFGVDSNGFGPNVQVSGRLVVDRNQVVADQGEQLGKDSRVLGTGTLGKGGITMGAISARTHFSLELRASKRGGQEDEERGGGG